MRYVFGLLTLLAAVLTIHVDREPPQIESDLCLRGGCRSDQLIAQLQKHGANDASAKALLVQDASNPASWCTYGEYLAILGDTDNAVKAFDRALQLGSGLAAIRMRAANFDFAHGRSEAGWQHVPVILTSTDAFDNVLFTYLERFPPPQSRLLGGIIPANSRAARSWLEWVRYRTPEQVAATWQWVSRNHFEDDRSLRIAAEALWNQKQFPQAYEVWKQHAAMVGAVAEPGELLFNPAFEQEPQSGPFEWHLERNGAVEYRRENGLEIRFLGTENVELTTLEQSMPVHAGPYRLSLDYSAEEISTDQGPFFRITDVEDAKRFQVETLPALGTQNRQKVAKEFTVPGGTRGVRLQLVRLWSPKINNKIKGTLHLYRIGMEDLRTR